MKSTTEIDLIKSTTEIDLTESTTEIDLTKSTTEIDLMKSTTEIDLTESMTENENKTEYIPVNVFKEEGCRVRDVELATGIVNSMLDPGKPQELLEVGEPVPAK